MIAPAVRRCATSALTCSAVRPAHADVVDQRVRDLAVGTHRDALATELRVLPDGDVEHVLGADLVVLGIDSDGFSRTRRGRCCGGGCGGRLHRRRLRRRRCGGGTLRGRGAGCSDRITRRGLLGKRGRRHDGCSSERCRTASLTGCTTSNHRITPFTRAASSGGRIERKSRGATVMLTRKTCRNTFPSRRRRMSPCW